MTTLTGAELLILRRQYIRDEAIKNEGSTPASYLSRYNSDTGKNYFSDDDLKAIDERVRAVSVTALASVWETAYVEHLAQGEDTTTADTAADKVQQDARFRLIRTECWTLQMTDPRFRSTLMVGGDASAMTTTFDQWGKTMESDQAVASETGGGLFSVPVVRR